MEMHHSSWTPAILTTTYAGFFFSFFFFFFFTVTPTVGQSTRVVQCSETWRRADSSRSLAPRLPPPPSPRGLSPLRRPPCVPVPLPSRSPRPSPGPSPPGPRHEARCLRRDASTLSRERRWRGGLAPSPGLLAAASLPLPLRCHSRPCSSRPRRVGSRTGPGRHGIAGRSCDL